MHIAAPQGTQAIDFGPDIQIIAGDEEEESDIEFVETEDAES